MLLFHVFAWRDLSPKKWCFHLRFCSDFLRWERSNFHNFSWRNIKLLLPFSFMNTIQFWKHNYTSHNAVVSVEFAFLQTLSCTTTCVTVMQQFDLYGNQALGSSSQLFWCLCRASSSLTLQQLPGLEYVGNIGW